MLIFNIISLVSHLSYLFFLQYFFSVTLSIIISRFIFWVIICSICLILPDSFSNSIQTNSASLLPINYIGRTYNIIAAIYVKKGTNIDTPSTRHNPVNISIIKVTIHVKCIKYFLFIIPLHFLTFIKDIVVHDKRHNRYHNVLNNILSFFILVYMHQ